MPYFCSLKKVYIIFRAETSSNSVIHVCYGLFLKIDYTIFNFEFFYSKSTSTVLPICEYHSLE